MQSKSSWNAVGRQIANLGPVLWKPFSRGRISLVSGEPSRPPLVEFNFVGTATAMAWALTQSGFSRTLAVAMAQVPGGSAGFMALTIVVFVILGSVLEGVPALVLLAPLLFPIARSLGIHEVHYAMVVILAMGVGLFAPPFGVGFFTACAIGNVDPDAAMARIWPYLGALLIGVVIIAAVPWISVGFLPR